MMTENEREEAINNVKLEIESGYINLGLHDQNEIEVIREAIDKQVSIDAKTFPEYETILCPVCGAIAFDEKTFIRKGYCFRCGQKLKWEW